DQSSARAGQSGRTRLTTPSRVPSVIGASDSASGARPTTRSPAAKVMSSVTGIPPARLGASWVGGRAGTSTTLNFTSRPREVTIPGPPPPFAPTLAGTPRGGLAPPRRRGRSAPGGRRVAQFQKAAPSTDRPGSPGAQPKRRTPLPMRRTPGEPCAGGCHGRPQPPRSEERRVGKECTSRGSADRHDKERDEHVVDGDGSGRIT